MTLSATLRALLAGSIDYAGLFPPAQLSMAEAVERYSEYLQSQHSWALGRFVLPAAQLEPFLAARRAVGQHEQSWRASAIFGTDIDADCAAIRRFNEGAAGWACVDSVEMKARGLPAVRDQTAAAFLALPPSTRVFVELSVGADVRTSMTATRASHGLAKIRTGGITSDAFPSSRELADFILACARESVPFKATAGLHHACRGSYSLTYQANAPKTMMFGFLNVLVAAVCARCGVAPKQIVEILESEQVSQFRFDDRELGWRDVRVSRAQVEESRRNFVLSFGSCSFQEPIQDLRGLSLL